MVCSTPVSSPRVARVCASPCAPAISTASGYAVATGPDSLRVRVPKRGEQASVLDPLPASMQDELAYFAGVIRGTIAPSGLSSLENNMIATEILEAARESARTGKTVPLSPTTR